MVRYAFDEPHRRDGDALPGRLPKNGRPRSSLGPAAKRFTVHPEPGQRQRVTHDGETLLILSKRERRALRRRTGHHSARQERKRVKATTRRIRAKARMEAAARA